jgi:hypothetical protein
MISSCLSAVNGQVRHSILLPDFLSHTGCGKIIYFSGFHARDPETFAQAVHDVITMPEEERVAIRAHARRWATTTFSREAFERGWTRSGWRQWL